MTRRRGKPSGGTEFVAGFKETASWSDPKPRQARMELPLPDYAPFAVPSDEVWRELQRRRNLVRMVETLAQSARDEGFPLSSQILRDTASKLRDALILVEASRQGAKPSGPSRRTARQTPEVSEAQNSAPSPRRKNPAPAHDQSALGVDPCQVVDGAATTSTADALTALEEVARVLRKGIKG